MVIVLALVLVHQGAHVELRDATAFAGYLALWIVLPGTLAWRWVTAQRGDRPLAEDLAFGALVGYVIEAPAYLVCLALGHPHAYVLWPALVVLATLPTRTGRGLWRRRRLSMPLRWSWAASGLLALVVLWFAHNVWGPVPVTRTALQEPYLDEPYHLSLIASLRHFLPPRVLYVDHTKLQYHWLSHLHMAAASWVTGVQPIVLLRALAIPAAFLFVALAMAHAAVRLTGAGWSGLVLLGGLFIGPATVAGWGDSGTSHTLRLLNILLLNSPSAGFSFAAIVLVLVLCVELLRRRLTGALPWILTGVGMVAMLGAKSTTLPTFMAGLVAAAVLTPLLTRRFDKVAAGLAVLAFVAFVVGTPLFFGFGSHGLSVDPFYFTSENGALPRPAAALDALTFLDLLSTGAGLFALLTRRGHREPENLFWIFLCLGGLGATLTFHQVGSSEGYFMYAILAPMLLGGVVGLHRLIAPPLPAKEASARHQRVLAMPDHEALRTGVLTFLAAVCAGSVLIAVDHPLRRDRLTGSAYRQVFIYYLAPMLALLGIAALLTVVVSAVRRRQVGPEVRRGTTGVVLLLTLAGLGASLTLHGTWSVLSDPWNRTRLVGEPLIADGGIQAALWLRDHSGQNDLVATNAHCQRTGDPDPCPTRNFWMAGYSERQFLVEGWAYVSASTVGREPAANPENDVSEPFWDPERLAANDAVFSDPTAAIVGRLATRYHVRWLLLDRRYRARIHALDRLATLRFSSGDYLVYRLR